MRAVHLYLKYDRNFAAVCRELGYPSRRTLKRWVEEHKATGTLHDEYHARPPKYSKEQVETAVDYYLNHGQSLRGTVHALGYPNRGTLKRWINEKSPEICGSESGRLMPPKVEFTREQKEAAVVDLCLRDVSAQEVAKKYGISRVCLYRWKRHLLGEEYPVSKLKREKTGSVDDRSALLKKVKSLQEQVQALEKQVHRLQLERDVLEMTAEILKKTRASIRKD